MTPRPPSPQNIVLPKDLPAAEVLRNAGVAVVDGTQERGASGNAVRVALLNLMPNKPVTELQFAALLASAPFPVDLTLVRVGSRASRHTPSSHLNRYYRTWNQIAGEPFDALIVTGAPVETMAFHHVDYWSELQAIFDWAEASVPRSLFICWAAQAALYHRFGIGKRILLRKAFGVYEQTVRRPGHPMLAGLGPTFNTPVSRHTDVLEADVAARSELDILAASEETGLCLVGDEGRGSLMMFNHLEYGDLSLDVEYTRDRLENRDIAQPVNYYPENDPSRVPVDSWSESARTFFSNWISDAARARRSGTLVASGRSVTSAQNKAPT